MKELTLKEMRTIADEMAVSIVIRDKRQHCDVRKKSTKSQHQILSGIIFSALSTRVWRNASAGIDTEKQAILDMALTCANTAVPGCNGYLTVYSPLESLFSDLEKEAE